MSRILSVKSLTASLRSGVAIVDGISFDIAAGETYALLGESGCGKSMTALTLMRLLPDGIVHAGKAQLDRIELFDLPEREMRNVRGGKMAMVFQEPGLSLNPVMTVGQQIAEVLALHGGLRSSQSTPTPLDSPLSGGKAVSSPDGTTSHSTKLSKNDSQVAGYDKGRPGGIGVGQHCIKLLQQVGIPDAARRVAEYPFQLSGGMKQRVMIAMALAGQPKLLIADEPTTALDVTIQAQVLQLLRDTQDHTGMAILLITHDLGVVAETAHQVGVMYAGQIIEQASRAQLFARPLHPYTQKLFAALPHAARGNQPLAAIPGSVPPLGSITNGCRFAPRCDKAWSLCHEQTPAWTVIDASQGVRCHLYSETGKVKSKMEKQVEIMGEQSGGVSPFTFHLSPDTSSTSILQVSDLRVHFPIRKGILQRVVGQVKAVDGVSLEISQGRTLALVGESGCGKTTLGKALLQLIKPTSGSVQFSGRELIGLHGRELRNQRATMQMVFQDPYASLNPKMRVAEILEEGMAALRTPSPSFDKAFSPERSRRVGTGQASSMGKGSQFGSSAARQAHIDILLDQVGLARNSKWRYPHEFSGGQRQRIAIARALAVSPQLLICDEPTSALDVSVQAQILNLLKTLQQELNLSYLFITHNLAVVEYLAHEVCVMYLGRIVERGTAEEVLHSPKHPYTQALLSAVPRIDGTGRERIRLAGDMPSSADPPVGCHFAPRCVHVMEQCRLSYPPASRHSATHHAHCFLYAEQMEKPS